MATTETPPSQPSNRANGYEEHEVPHLLVQLQDDLARSRMREAFWMSLFFHMVIAVIVATSPKWMPTFTRPAVVVATPQELMQQRELTYLDLPPDVQKITKRPDTNVISDKDRIAASRTPSIDKKELNKILDSARPGAPGQAGIPGPPARPSPPVQQQMAQQGQSAPAQQGQGGVPAQPSPSSQNSEIARLEGLQQQARSAANPFMKAMSPGKAIEQAARAAAQPGGGAIGGASGDYGLGGNNRARAKSDIDILSDTAGVDFGPYLSRLLHEIRTNWINLAPDSVRAPLFKRGKLAIEFAVMKDGSVAGMRIVAPSGDVALDRAAWGGISVSSPFPPLPSEFRGNYLQLRIRFYYNPSSNELQ
ncbi:MAG TPA: TonB family protein [Terriglobales bacterium]|nr:TonB family protein [Terriglobales bacterium]